VKPPFRLVNSDGLVEWSVDPAWRSTQARPVVTAERLGKTSVGNLPYERPDGSPVRVDRDLLGTARYPANSTPGPVENPGTGSIDWSGRVKSKVLANTGK
jgi:hypothetical protein